ncbi:hypothetical protein M758_9G140700 [Ceratodon purpureus]|nr:hypothetical protein M758_9G140700 [Ceratodon purpureus]
MGVHTLRCLFPTLIGFYLVSIVLSAACVPSNVPKLICTEEILRMEMILWVRVCSGGQ